jgi:DNA repair ATPase RecN
MALTEHQKALRNARQKRFYQRNKLRILEKNKQDRLTIKRLRDATSDLNLQDIADHVSDPVHAVPHLVYNLPTLISLFEKEKDDVRKPLAMKTIQKHISEIKNIYRILDIPREESLM